jgi:glycosyltransferase involved in cell wall biosynthesis
MSDTPQTPANPAPAVSVVVLVNNQRENIRRCYEELHTTLTQPFEIIMVDDGSTDGSFDQIHALALQDPQLRVVRLRREFGNSAALAAGFDRARAPIIVTYDAAGQTQVADIPRILAPFEQGYELVSGWRNTQSAPLLQGLGNGIISLLTGVKLHDYGCPLKAYRAEIVRDLSLYGDLYRFLPALASWQGVEIYEVPIAGKVGNDTSKRQTLGRSAGVLLDLITVRFTLGYMGKPMQQFGRIGGFLSLLGFILGLYLIYDKIVLAHNIGERPLLLLSALLLIVGVQFIIFGLLAELTIRSYYEINDKPTYSVRETVENQKIIKY